MSKLKPAFFALPICVLCFLISLISGYASDESLTITTYYPSPYGSYNQLQTNSLGVGDVNGDGTLNSSDVPPNTTPPYGDLWIAGNITVGGVKYAHVPRGAVMFFNLTSCPSGWSELTAARGRYLVGLPAGGTLVASVGTALTNTENRAVGQHAHTATQVSHQHNFGNNPDLSGGGPGMSSNMDAEWGGNKFTNSQTPAITVNNAGSVAGTNAPYLQLLVCQKD